MAGLLAGLFSRSREPSEVEPDEPLRLPSLASLERQEKIGHGAFGSVYLYLDKSPSAALKQYAVKIIRMDRCNESIERFQNEVTALKMCRQENIVRFYSSSIVGDQLWILMEYIAGGSASHVLRKMGPFSEPSCAVVVHDTLQALRYLNNDGRLHLDIKPANILLTLDGRCKLCDLGVAQALFGVGEKPRRISELEADSPQEESKLSQKRLKMAGTLLYMSPEMLVRKASTANTDVWSLGISSIELATAHLPNCELPRSRATSVIVHYPAPLLEGKFTAAFKEFVAQCLIKDPAERPTAVQMLEHRFVKDPRGRSKLADVVRKCKSKGDDHSSRSSSSQENSEDEEQWRFRGIADVEWDFRGL
eukprot:m.230952 g.230952  ORF g.230952 m.230952 type:complete len:363 (+) comp18201_c0_seq1:54-1142(+)